MDRLFEGVPGEIIVDDFLVHGKDQIEVDGGEECWILEKSAGQEERRWIEVEPARK